MSTDRLEYRDGHFVSQKVSQVIAAIQDYCPDIEVLWLPPSARTVEQAAFKIVHNDPDTGRSYTIRHVKTEEEFDTRILYEIILGDQRNGKADVSAVEAAERAAKAVAHQRYLDEVEEANELAASIIRSNKSTYKVNDNLIISDYKLGNQAVKPRLFT